MWRVLTFTCMLRHYNERVLTLTCMLRYYNVDSCYIYLYAEALQYGEFLHLPVC